MGVFLLASDASYIYIYIQISMLLHPFFDYITCDILFDNASQPLQPTMPPNLYSDVKPVNNESAHP